MRRWSVRELAKELSLSEQRLRVMARAGQLPATKTGERWVIEADPTRLRRPTPGRPLAAPNAWALLALLSGDSPDWVHPSVRSRLRRRLTDIDWLEAALIHSEPRAQILRCRVLPGDLSKLRVECHLVYSGLSANHAELDVLPDPQRVDAYVAENLLRAIKLRFRPQQPSSNPNLTLRVPSHDWILRQEACAPQAVVAADLLGHEDPRVARAARRLLGRVIHDRDPRSR
jgi:hypothetical protein